jgi:type I restriction enzyme M protein
MREAQFLKDLDKRLWTAADRLRANLDAAVYKHVVLGLIFLKYVSDAFKERRAELEGVFRDPNHDYYLGEDADDLIPEELETRDYYTEKNVFWVPALARWDFLQAHAKVAVGTVLTVKNGKSTEYKFNGIGRLLDDALEAVERENPKLKGVLEKDYARKQIDAALPGLIDLIAEIPFHHGTLKAKDILGHVYEYFLGEFAIAEGKKGGQYYTPKSIVTLIVEMLEPYQGRVYDPCCGSGGFFVQSEKFVEEHGGRIGQLSVYGQESNPTTWRLASMNMAIRGMDFDFGKEPANTFGRDQHPDLRADFIMANPPFNMKEWNAGVKDDDPRWKYGTPPAGNANFAWMQHMIHHLAPHGSMALLLANGSMSSNTNNEGEIRKALIEADLIECMVALPGQLFTNTQIPACIWFLSKNKSPSTSMGKGRDVDASTRDRRGEVLFIDARNLGYMKDRVLRDFSPEDIRKIADTFHVWRSSPPLPLGEGRGEGQSTGKHQKIPEYLLKNARELRKNQTDAESLIWDLVRDRQIANCKFRRQHPVGPYILDFYCHEKKLAIELDGGQHNTGHGIDRDHQRTRFLNEQGISVLRFWNNDVSQNTEAVLETIYESLAPHPSPLPQGEGAIDLSPSTGAHPSLSERKTGHEGKTTYYDIPGFCKAAKLEEIRKHDYVLTPGRYVGAAAQEADGEPFEEKMARLTARLNEQFAESARLEAAIRENLARLGYGG